MPCLTAPEFDLADLPKRKSRRERRLRRCFRKAPCWPIRKGNYVYVVNAKNEVERRPVQIGEVSDEGVTIREGLSGNEQVVVSAGPFLNPGQKVAPRKIAISAALTR